MTLQANISNAFSAVGVDVKNIKSKLDGVEVGATADQTGAEIATLYEALANTNKFTDSEKTKLAGLEGSKFLGTYTSISALNTAHPSPAIGSYAHVDSGVGVEAAVMIWDDSDNEFVQQSSASGQETAASIKTKYESNADTNAFTDALLGKLNGVEAGATADQSGTEIAAAYEALADTNKYTDAAKATVDDIGSTTTNFSTVYTTARDT